MTWIILLLAVGLILFFVELFFIPGTTVVGILGVIFIALGIYLGYHDHGTTTGHISLAITLIALIVIIIVGAKSNVWGKLSIKEVISGKANLIEEGSVKAGDRGEAISAIKPMGKAQINNQHFEVRSLGEFINTGSEIEVVKVTANRITVIAVNSENTNSI